MTSKQEKLIENYVRQKVKKMLKEADLPRASKTGAIQLKKLCDDYLSSKLNITDFIKSSRTLIDQIDNATNNNPRIQR